MGPTTEKWGKVRKNGTNHGKMGKVRYILQHSHGTTQKKIPQHGMYIVAIEK